MNDTCAVLKDYQYHIEGINNRVGLHSHNDKVTSQGRQKETRSAAALIN